MKKRLYLQPAIKVTGFLPLWLMETTPGWSRDGNPPTTVIQEDGVDDTDPWSDGGYEGFLDLD